MADVGAPHAGRTVEDATTVGGEIVHILRTSEHARLALKGAVRGERHPIGVKIVWGRDSRARVLNIHEVFLPKNFWVATARRTLAASFTYRNALMRHVERR